MKNVSGCKLNKIQYTLRLNTYCNRDCDYCHYHENGIRKKYTLSEIELSNLKKIIDITYNHSKDKDQILYYIHGGEPFLIENISEILKYIKSFDKTQLEIQTNFDFSSNLLSNLKYIDKVSISFHYPMSYSEIDKRIRMLNFKALKEKIFNIDLIYKKDQEDALIYSRTLLEKLHIPSEFTYNFFEAGNNEDFLKKLFRAGITLLDEEKRKNDYFAAKYSYYNIDCDNSKYCIINPNGDVFRCSNALTQNDIAGNILNGFNLNEVLKVAPCMYQYCGYEKDYIEDI